MPETKILNVKFSNLLLFDRLYELSIEYSVSADLLINVAVKKLIDDVDLLRNLRSRKINLE